MRAINFISLHGVRIYGSISNEIRIGMIRISVVYALGKTYAVLDGQSIVEMDGEVMMGELTELIKEELKK